MDSTSTLILPFNCLVGIEQPTNAEGRLYNDDIPLSYWNSYDSVHYITGGSDGLGYLRWFVEAGSYIKSSISQNVKILPIINNTNDDYVAHFRFSFNEIASGYAFSQMSDYVSSLPVKVFEPLSSTIVPDSFEYPVGAVWLSCVSKPSIICSVNSQSTYWIYSNNIANVGGKPKVQRLNISNTFGKIDESSAVTLFRWNYYSALVSGTTLERPQWDSVIDALCIVFDFRYYKIESLAIA